MENLAWSNGVKAIRSYRKNTSNKCENNLEQTDNTAEHKISDVCDKNCKEERKYDLAYDYKLSNMETINTFDLTDNRRDIFNDKLSTRTVISKACMNPFQTHLNYTDDILKQERFLIPKNSNMEKEYS